mgnify:CR=1 FL=1
MVNEQPEALQLAEVAPYLENGERGQWIVAAAAELRRLHESNTELLEALKDLLAETGGFNRSARAAINKAERTTP